MLKNENSNILFLLLLNSTASGLNYTGFMEDEWRFYCRYFQHWRKKHLAVAKHSVRLAW